MSIDVTNIADGYDDPEVQRLGWRGWLNKYYGDSLRSKMNIDPSGYKGMHVSGGL